MARPDLSGDSRLSDPFGRRRFIAAGGFGVATAALLAACGKVDSPGIARVGVAPTVTALPDAVVNDVVLLRTASSLEHSIVSVYDELLGNADLLDTAMYGEMIQRFRDAHAEFATTFEGLTTQAGGEPWTCGNPRLDDVVLAPIRRAIAGGEATDLLAATPVSDDPHRDALNLAHALESVAAATYQGMMPSLSDPRLRREAVLVGANEARHAALLAINITGAPFGYANPADVANAGAEAPTTTAAPTTTQNIAAPATDAGAAPTPSATPIPPVFAMPGTFGRLAAVQLVVGAPNESGTRLTVNLDTPSLNTYVYEYLTPACE